VPENQRLSSKLSAIHGHRILYAPDDHIIEFYPFLAQVKDGVDALPYGLAKDAKEQFPTDCLPAASPASEVRASFFAEYQRLLDATSLPDRSSDPLTGEGIAAVIGAIATGRRLVCIANLANQGCIPNLPGQAEVEVEAVTDSSGIRGLQMGEAPLALKGILEKRFVWHELVADAAVKGDRNLALQAMLLDEMAILPEQAEAMLAELLAASRDLLPQFQPQTTLGT
jgi:alpha-galactosidase/6-phospho-beta-glucosidase family protein